VSDMRNFTMPVLDGAILKWVELPLSQDQGVEAPLIGVQVQASDTAPYIFVCYVHKEGFMPQATIG